MPIFEFECPACGTEFEHLVLKGSAPVRCPTCEGEDLEKKISASSVSSEGTRKRATQAIRTRNRALRRDYGHEEVKRMEAHAKDHEE